MTIRELRNKKNQLLADMQKIALAGFTTESRSAYDKMNTALESTEAAIILEERMQEGRSFERSAGRGRVSNETHSEGRSALQSYIQTGERRDLLTTSDTQGGALVQQEFEGVLHEALKFYGPIATKVAQRRTDNGAPMKHTFANDTSNGLTLLATEGTSSPSETDPAFRSVIVGTDTVTGGLVKVSFQELEDSNFNLDTWLRDAFGVRYGRGIERAITLGVDSAGTALPNFVTGGLLGTATAVPTVSTTLAAGIGWDDITNTLSNIDPAYAGPGASWSMNYTTRNYLLGLKDGFGRPYFTPDPSADRPFDKLLGYEIVLNQSMPNVGTASATPILFGDLQKAFLLRTDGQPRILRLNERYAELLEVGFYLYSRIGGISLNAGVAPVVKLQQPAS